MNRQVLRSAFGRAAAPHTTTPAPARRQALSTPTPTTFFPLSSTPATASRFTTSSAGGGSSPDNGDGGNSGRNSPRNAAVQRLTQLNTNRVPNGELRGLDDVPGIVVTQGPRSVNFSDRGGPGGVDARSLRSALRDGGDAPAAGRVLNVRSLRGGIRGAFRGGLRDGAPFGRPGGMAGGSGSFGAGRFGGRSGGRFGRGRMGARGGAARGEKRIKPKESPKERTQGKMVWSEDEQAVIDRLEKGEVVPFEPSVTLDTLAGYGPALATDASVGQVETAMRVMRLMTGGMAFNAESGVTTDLKVVQNRYLHKMPIFVHSKAEREWIESANPRLRIAPPDAATKKAIFDAAILGHYEAQGFAEAKDVKATMANYHSRTFTYMGSDAQKFADKVLSLLPAESAKKPAASARARK